MGRLQLVRGETPAPEPHGFDRVSRNARSDKRLSHTGFRVLAAIESYCWGDSRECWTSNRTLGEQAGGVSAHTVRRAIGELKQLGYLKVVDDPTKARGQKLQLTYALKKPVVVAF